MTRIMHPAVAIAAATALLSALVPTTVRADAPVDVASEPELRNEFVRVVILGATGNLAAKYLWVAVFRLALQAYEVHAHKFEFIAAATYTRESGEQWLENFFDDAFLRRVCGSDEVPSGDGGDELETSEDSKKWTSETTCTRFFHECFVTSVRYAPLRGEEHYQQLEKILKQEEDAKKETAAKVEIGRLVYLAIPPKFFAQVRVSIGCLSLLQLPEIPHRLPNLLSSRRAVSSPTSTCDRSLSLTL